MSVETILEKAKTLETSYKDQFSVLFKQSFELFKDKAQKIVIQTYTPGFNDGDPCKYTIGNIFVDGVNEYGEKASDYGDDSYGIDKELTKDQIEEAKKLSVQIWSLVNNFKTFLEKTYGTDKAIIIDLVNDTIITEDYDCGY